jgi:hypothetical protein
MTSKQELVEYLREHVSYELLMLRFARAQIARSDLELLDWNSRFETFILHGRLL